MVHQTQFCFSSSKGMIQVHGMIGKGLGGTVP